MYIITYPLNYFSYIFGHLDRREIPFEYQSKLFLRNSTRLAMRWISLIFHNQARKHISNPSILQFRITVYFLLNHRRRNGERGGGKIRILNCFDDIIAPSKNKIYSWIFFSRTWQIQKQEYRFLYRRWMSLSPPLLLPP